MKICGVIFVVLGVAFLLRDLSVWTFWNIQWWTAVLLAVGLGHFASSGCPECMAVRGGKKK